MEPFSLAVLLVMGTLAGMINAAVGSGSLLTLPVLLTLGLPPGTAVRTNTIGILFSTIGAVYGYRREIAAEKRELGPLTAAVLLGAGLGALLLLAAPPGALDVVVPVLIVVALFLVVFQKRITAAIRRQGERRRAKAEQKAAATAQKKAAATARKQAAATAATAPTAGATAPTAAATGAAVPARIAPPGTVGREAIAAAAAERRSVDRTGRHRYRSPAVIGSMGAASVYGGFFTAAQGIIYLGILGALTGRPMRQVNSVKNLGSLLVNAVAAAIYVVAFFAIGAEVVWIGSAAIAVGALLGGYFGAHVAKKLPEWMMRGIIVVVALAALVDQLI